MKVNLPFKALNVYFLLGFCFQLPRASQSFGMYFTLLFVQATDEYFAYGLCHY